MDENVIMGDPEIHKEIVESRVNLVDSILIVYQAKLDDLLASECPLCGNAIIDQIYIPLDDDEEEARRWSIN